ncbi:MAG: hypothetical protein DME26_03690 [Verrucomicrobia bacterium]|nr:MAG: hypothetical protein DME26_03690 [Verrucomicrobiota bacterium]
MSSCVLVVDDVPKNLQVVGTMLRNAGYSIMPATSGAEALDGVREQLPDLILLDLMMPEMDGFEFVAELRKRGDWHAIPIIVITAKDLTVEDHLRLNGYVTKILQKSAYSRETLLAEVRDLVAACVNKEMGATVKV